MINENQSKPGFRTRLFHLLFLFLRPMTLGVRVVISNEKGQILLVRHGYVAGWHLPGGGVEKGDSVLKTVSKELIEETGIEPISRPQLLAVYANRRASKRDHVLLYRCEKWKQVRAFEPNKEILEAKFFDLDNLPEGTTVSTLNRLAEMDGRRDFSEFW